MPTHSAPSRPRLRSAPEDLFRESPADRQLAYLAIGTSDLPSKQKLSLKLIELLHEKRRRENGGEHAIVRRGQSMSERDVVNLAVHMLRACSQVPPPPELVDLFIVLHGLDAPANDQTDHQLLNAAASLLAKYPDMSVRQIAARLGVAPNTVRNWTKTKIFIDFVEMCQKGLEEGGWQLVWLPPELDYPPAARGVQKENVP